MNQVEIALHHTVLAWLTMDGDIGIIEELTLAVFDKREIILVDLGCCAIIECHMPIDTLDVYYINIVTLFVEERVESLT